MSADNELKAAAPKVEIVKQRDVSKSRSTKQKAVKSEKPKRRRLTPEARRQEVIEASQRVFMRKGYHGAKTRDLAEEAGVNEATLFLYFKTKEDLFAAAIKEPLSDLIKGQAKKARAYGSAQSETDRSDIAANAIREMFDGVQAMTPLLMTALFADGDEGKQVYKKSLYPLIKQLRKSTKDNLKLTDGDTADFIVLAAFGLCFMMNVHYNMLGQEIDSEDLSERISGLLMHGIDELSP